MSTNIERDPQSLQRNPKNFEQLSDDQKVRSSIRSKEYTQIKKSNKDLDEEEEELKRFFQEGTQNQQAAPEDPTLVRTLLLSDIRKEKRC